MKIFSKILIFLCLLQFGFARDYNYFDYDYYKSPRHRFKSRGRSSIDWCKLKCGAEKNIVCQYGGTCDANLPCENVEMDKKAVLEAHNKFREQFASGKEPISGGITVSNMMALSWDEDLAYAAACNLINCEFKHDQCHNTPKFSTAGQNLWTMGSSTEVDCSAKAPDAVSSWYSEVKDTNAAQLKSDAASYSFASNTGHFTALIWATTTHVGCALTKKKEGGSTSCFMACNYGPAGNMMQSSMFKEGSPCSACPGDIKCGSTFPSLCGEPTVSGRNAGINIRPVILLSCFICLIFLVQNHFFSVK